MALSKRLLALYAMVEKGSVAADIGCDHAQLAIALVQNGICDHVYASDLRAAPLACARRAVAAAGLSERIRCTQCDGMDDLPADVDTILIAGMGFDTICHILTAHEAEVRAPRRFIVQSNTHSEKLRQWISEHHFTIDREDLVWEDHFYEVIAFHCDEHRPYSECECRFGVHLAEHPLREAYLRDRLKKIRVIQDHLPANHERKAVLDSWEAQLRELLIPFDQGHNKKSE